jgi:hypothetical protein
MQRKQTNREGRLSRSVRAPLRQRSALRQSGSRGRATRRRTSTRPAAAAQTRTQSSPAQTHPHEEVARQSSTAVQEHMTCRSQYIHSTIKPPDTEHNHLPNELPQLHQHDMCTGELLLLRVRGSRRRRRRCRGSRRTSLHVRNLFAGGQ